MRLITRGSEFKIRRILPKWIFHLLLNALCLGAPKMNEKETGICPHLTKCRKVSPFQLSSSSSNLICIEPFLMNFALSPVLVFQNAKLCVSPVLTKLVSHVYISTISLSPPSLSRILCLSLSVSLQSYHTVSHTHTQPYLHTHSLSHSHSCIRTTSTFYIPTLTTYTSTPTLDFAHAHPPVCPDAKI